MNVKAKWWIPFAAVGGALALYANARGMQPSGVKRPPIVGVAHIALESNDISAARKFYGEQLGYAVLDAGKSDTDSAALRFKVNDHQYIEVRPGLKTPEQDRLSHIAFETADARGL